MKRCRDRFTLSDETIAIIEILAPLVPEEEDVPKYTPLKIVTNKIMCNACNDVIESKHRHDFKTCKCGIVSVDGGKDYLRRCGDDYTELSTTEHLI